jgi:hypothetical protein
MACCMRWGISGIPLPCPIPAWTWVRLQQRKQSTIQVLDWFLFLWFTISIHFLIQSIFHFLILLIKGKLSLCLTTMPHRYTGGWRQLHPLMSVIDENKWPLYHGETVPGSNRRGGWMDLRAGLDMVAKRKIPAHTENQAPSHLSQSQSSHWIILAYKVTQFEYVSLHVRYSNMPAIHWMDGKMKFMSVLIADNLKMTQNII